MKLTQIIVRFSEAEIAFMDDTAKEDGITRAEFVRRAVRHYLASKSDDSVSETVRREIRNAMTEQSNLLADNLQKSLMLMVGQERQFFNDLRSPGSAKPASVQANGAATKYGSLR